MNNMFQSSCTEVFTNEEAQVDEKDEFAGEYAFHNDYLLYEVEEVIKADL